MTTPKPDQRRRTDRYGRAAFVLSAIAILLSVVFSATALVNRHDYLTLKEGRRVGVAATCPLIVAVIDAGGNVIQGGERGGLLPGDALVRGRFVPGPLTRLLGPTFPGYAQRKANAAAAAAKYKREIAAKLSASLREAGVKSPPLRDGTVSCQKFAVVVKAR